MKKLFLTMSVFLCLSSVAVNAQDDSERVKGTETKSGQQILPKAGDIALGIDATPFFKYVGNMFNNSENNDGSNLFQGQDQTIYMKYFLQDNRAIRVKLMFNLENTNKKSEVPDKTDASKQVEDQVKHNSSEFMLTAGYEFRRGYGRLQGYAGPQVAVGIGNESTKYQYGNDITVNNSGSRVKEANPGGVFTIGAGGFVGIEYFVAPKISLGGEFGVNYAFFNNGKSKYTTQRWNNNTSSVETTTTEAYPNSPATESYFGTQTQGNIFVMFHF